MTNTTKYLRPSTGSSMRIVVWVLGLLVVLPAAVAAGAPSPKPGGFRSPNLGPGQGWDLVLPSAGTYQYHCTPHPGMRGTIEVAANATSLGAAVEIKGYRFQPAATWVAPNATVTFTNRDEVVHTATETAADTGGGGSGSLSAPLVLLGVVLGAFLLQRRP